MNNVNRENREFTPLTKSAGLDSKLHSAEINRILGSFKMPQPESTFSNGQLVSGHCKIRGSYMEVELLQ